MAKINTANIEGYEDMTPEEKVAALEALEYEDNLSELERYRNAAKKASSEAAEWKRKHNALLSDEEQKKAAAEEEHNKLLSRVKELERDKLVSGHKADFLAMGYEETLATETAEALADGNTAKVFANQKKFLEAHDKTMKANLMKNTPAPPAGDGSGVSVDYNKKAAEAQAAGNYSEAAYYIRRAQENKSE
ncbi:MAG: hypothetical protein ACI4IS_02845 [Acutalibacteraceae bacterium]